MFNYRNPFAEYNSNTMSSKQISELFTEPFDFFDISPLDIEGDKSSIIFIGGRGTGKTMLLRQFSYNVQRVALTDRVTFLNKVKSSKCIGIYFRIDTPLQRSLDSIATYSNQSNSFAGAIFTHYFELTVFKDYLEIIKILLSDSSIKKGSESYNVIIKELKSLIDCPQTSSICDLDEFLSFVVDQINYIWKYQSKKAIDLDGSVKFVPSCGMMLYGRLSNDLLKTNILHTLDLDDVNILLLIDEFENFSENQQRVFNTAMRFTKEYGVKFRIGMRPNGFKTYGTLDDVDFVKEGRDYRKVEFGFSFIKKGNELYSKLVKRIANKRLSVFPQFKDKFIEDILGKSENLEEEAKEIVKGRSKHFNQYVKLINQTNQTKYLSCDLLCLKHENPLFEMENLRLLLSGETLEYVCKAFNDYLNDVDSDEKKKYFNDYNKKYKLTFVLVLCSIYRVERKLYYSFLDYCQLSSGIIGCFIELCRRAFDVAYFKERDALFNGHISSIIQTDAAYDAASTERDMIQRITMYGSKLNILIGNIGNTFTYINKDLYMRYPETNLFPVVLGSLAEKNTKLLEVACMWSLLIKKPNAQDAKAEGQKQDIYYLNRVLAPFFKISYRTRGGFNPISFNDSYFEATFDPQSVLPAKKKREGIKQEKNQVTLFSILTDDNDEND